MWSTVPLVGPKRAERASQTLVAAWLILNLHPSHSITFLAFSSVLDVSTWSNALFDILSISMGLQPPKQMLILTSHQGLRRFYLLKSFSTYSATWVEADPNHNLHCITSLSSAEAGMQGRFVFCTTLRISARAVSIASWTLSVSQSTPDPRRMAWQKELVLLI